MSNKRVIAEIERLGRQRKFTAEESLYAAVANYVNKKGGTVVVAGGIQVQQWPGDNKLNYVVGVKCTGKVPKYVDQTGEAPK